jgi:hypothetical protein
MIDSTLKGNAVDSRFPTTGSLQTYPIESSANSHFVILSEAKDLAFSHNRAHLRPTEKNRCLIFSNKEKLLPQM